MIDVDDGAVWRARLEELRRQINGHPGAVARLGWDEVRRTYQVFLGNFADLRALLVRASTDMELAIELVKNVPPFDVREKFQATLDRFIHNYVAATKSLVDHTRRLTQRYGGSPFAVEYEQRKKLVAAAGATAFVNDLRNFVLHRALPLTGHTVRFQRDPIEEFESQAYLQTRSLLEWDGWSSKAKDYLAARGETVDLSAAIEDHMQLVRALYDWLFAQFGELHRVDIDEVNKLVNLYNEVLQGRA